MFHSFCCKYDWRDLGKICRKKDIMFISNDSTELYDRKIYSTEWILGFLFLDYPESCVWYVGFVFE